MTGLGDSAAGQVSNWYVSTCDDSWVAVRAKGTHVDFNGGRCRLFSCVGGGCRFWSGRNESRVFPWPLTDQVCTNCPASVRFPQPQKLSREISHPHLCHPHLVPSDHNVLIVVIITIIVMLIIIIIIMIYWVGSRCAALAAGRRRMAARPARRSAACRSARCAPQVGSYHIML